MTGFPVFGTVSTIHDFVKGRVILRAQANFDGKGMRCHQIDELVEGITNGRDIGSEQGVDSCLLWSKIMWARSAND